MGDVIFFEPGDATRYRVGLFVLPKQEGRTPRYLYCFGVGDTPLTAITLTADESMEFGYWAAKLRYFEMDRKTRTYSLSVLMHAWGTMNEKGAWGSKLKPLEELRFKEGWETPLRELAASVGLLDR